MAERQTDMLRQLSFYCDYCVKTTLRILIAHFMSEMLQNRAIILIIIQMLLFIVLSLWQSHCESSPGSFDDCRAAPRGR